MAPDEECSDFISPGRDVPPKYYLTNQTETTRDKMDRIVIGRGSTHRQKFVVEGVGNTLQWEFFSTDYDIAFGVYLQKTGAEKTEKEAIVSQLNWSTRTVH